MMVEIRGQNSQIVSWISGTKRLGLSLAKSRGERTPKITWRDSRLAWPQNLGALHMAAHLC